MGDGMMYGKLFSPCSEPTAVEFHFEDFSVGDSGVLAVL